MYHGLGSIAYGVKDNGFSTFLLLFYNQVLGMDAKLVSFALMLALVLDAFVDPVIGYLSDQTHTRWGRRLPWLYLAPIPLAFAWFALWTPGTDGTPGFWHLVIVAVIVRSLVSCCEVPSVALLPELTRDYDERTTLMRYRYLFGWAGGLLMLFLAYDVFLAKSLLQVEGYYQYGLVGGLLMAATVLISAAQPRHRFPRNPRSADASGLPRPARRRRDRLYQSGGHLLDLQLSVYLHLALFARSLHALSMGPVRKCCRHLPARRPGASALRQARDRNQRRADRHGLLGGPFPAASFRSLARRGQHRIDRRPVRLFLPRQPVQRGGDDFGRVDDRGHRRSVGNADRAPQRRHLLCR
jgi:MFS family permease